MRALISAALAIAGAAAGAEQPSSSIVAPAVVLGSAKVSDKSVDQVVPVGTPVRLMFLKEITSRSAHPGDKFRMRVDEPVYIDGKPIIPVGAIAWGEVVAQESNGAVGHGGKLSARLLYLDLPQGQLPLRGDIANRGGGNGAGVILAVAGFGPLGLLTAGDSARFKAGDMLTAYVANVPGL
jgi:hypothetical protein